MELNRLSEEKIAAVRLDNEAGRSARRSYAAPVLRVYGSVRQMTLGPSPAGDLDGVSGMAPRLSDRSAKQNIVRIGTHALGIGLYLFDYRPAYFKEAGMGRHFGVMADEVESVLPQAVGRHDGGLKNVDYRMLGIWLPDLHK